MACGIYKITNQINGKVYIGQSIKIEERWREHGRKPFSKTSEDYNYPLYQAIRKYGLENFTFEILEECSPEDLNQKEINYISLYESYPPEKGKGYNQTPGGGCGKPPKLQQVQIDILVDLLKNSSKSLNEIAKNFNIGYQSLSEINNGRAYYNSALEYPIRKYKRKYKRKNKSQHFNFCLICGQKISPNSQHCMKHRRITLRICLPPKEELLKDLYELKKDYLVAEKYGISTMLLKDWKIKLEIPRKRQLVDKLYEEEYLHILPRNEKPKNPNYMAPIKQIDKTNGEIVQIFSNVVEASKYIQFHYQQNNSLINIQTCIHNCLSKQIKTACGYIWEYLIQIDNTQN